MLLIKVKLYNIIKIQIQLDKLKNIHSKKIKLKKIIIYIISKIK